CMVALRTPTVVLPVFGLPTSATVGVRRATMQGSGVRGQGSGVRGQGSGGRAGGSRECGRVPYGEGSGDNRAGGFPSGRPAERNRQPRSLRLRAGPSPSGAGG